MAKVKISIRYKFLTAISLLLVGSVFAYLGLASHVFTQDKTQLVYDYNRSFVTNLSSELGKLLDTTSSKMKLSALLLKEDKDKGEIFENLFSNETNFSAMYLSRSLQSFEKEVFWDEDFFKAYGYNKKDFFEQVIAKEVIPWEALKTKGSYVWSLKSANNIPILAYAKVVITEGRMADQFVLMSLVRLDHLASSIRSNRLSQLFILNEDNALVFSGEKQVDNLNWDKVISKLEEKGVRSSVFSYEEANESYLAAYSKTDIGKLTVFSRAARSQALAVVKRFIYRSVLFASIVFTLAFIVAIIFSRNLTKPLDKLLQGMKKVAKGNLNVRIKLKSKDEIHVLAENFNHMIRDLKSSREELVEINRDLENKVKERTIKLEEQNKAVKDAQEALLRTSRLAAAGEIAGRAAHEVLNPLTSILTRLSVVEERLKQREASEIKLWTDITKAWKEDLQEGKEKLLQEWEKPSSIDASKSLLEEDIENISFVQSEINKEWDSLKGDMGFLLGEAYRINKIVQSMRSLNRTSEEKREHDLYDLVNEAFKIMADSMDQYSIKYEVTEALKGHLVLVDKDEFIQSVTNLLRNSIHSLQNISRDEKWIVTECEETEDGKVLLHIIDNGDGIAKDHHEKLFESNFSTKNSAEGTGLGLSISRRFIRSFDGELSLYSSEEGKGSNFLIQLPKRNSKGRASA
jgi:signal transduction histidine kinase